MHWVSYEEVLGLQFDEHDLDTASQYYHSDFMFISETEMLAWEDVRKHNVEDFFSGALISSNRKTLYEDQHTCTFIHSITPTKDWKSSKKDQTFTSRTCILKKEGLFWRRILMNHDTEV